MGECTLCGYPKSAVHEIYDPSSRGSQIRARETAGGLGEHNGQCGIVGEEPLGVRGRPVAFCRVAIEAPTYPIVDLPGRERVQRALQDRSRPCVFHQEEGLENVGARKLGGPPEAAVFGIEGAQGGFGHEGEELRCQRPHGGLFAQRAQQRGRGHT